MDLIARCKSISILEKNRIKSLGSRTKQRVLRIEEFKSIINGWKKMEKLELIKIKKFYSAEDTVTKMERQAIDQEKVFVYHVSEIGVLSRIYKELLKLCSKITIQLEK